MANIPKKQREKLDRDHILAELGDNRWVKSRIRAGLVKWSKPPPINNMLLTRLIDEEWFYADYEFNKTQKNPNRIAQAMVDMKLIYSSKPNITACALTHKQIGFIQWATKNNMSAYPRVEVV